MINRSLITSTYLTLTAALLLSPLTAPSADKSASKPEPVIEPVYLAQPWFHRAPEVNLLTTTGGVRVAVDNEGRHLVDRSIHAGLALDTLQPCAGEYYAATAQPAYGQTLLYTYYRISQGGKFLRSICCRHCPKTGPRARSKDCVRAADLRWTSSGRTAS